MGLLDIVGGPQMMALNSMFGGGSQTVTQEPMLTEEQIAAMKALLGLAQNGYLGNQGQSQFSKSIEEAIKKQFNAQPTLYNQAESEYQKILAGEYDPSNPNGYYKAYKNSALAEMADAADMLNSKMGASGNYFSTSRNRALSDLSAKTTNGLNNVLGQLFENNATNKQNALQSLVNLVGQKQGYNINNINLANGYNQQQLNNRIGAYGTILGKNVDWGSKSMTVDSNPFLDIIGKGVTLATTLLGGGGLGAAAATGGSGVSGLSSLAQSIYPTTYGYSKLGIY